VGQGGAMIWYRAIAKQLRLVYCRASDQEPQLGPSRVRRLPPGGLTGGGRHP
jgi:hypothetical protein